MWQFKKWHTPAWIQFPMYYNKYISKRGGKYHRRRKSSTRGQPAFFYKKRGILSPLRLFSGTLQAILVGAVLYHMIHYNPLLSKRGAIVVSKKLKYSFSVNGALTWFNNQFTPYTFNPLLLYLVSSFCGMSLTTGTKYAPSSAPYAFLTSFIFLFDALIFSLSKFKLHLLSR